MKYDAITAGVGGQGVLTVTAIIGAAALQEGFHAKQCEVHGMAQRGGAVLAHLRISDRPVESDLISKGAADLILGMEPLECLRYLPYLSPEGQLVTSVDPIINIPDYPDITLVLNKLRSLGAHLIETEELARRVGSKRSSNVLLVGAVSAFLPISAESIENSIRTLFARKGQRVVETNIQAFRVGREALQCIPT